MNKLQALSVIRLVIVLIIPLLLGRAIDAKAETISIGTISSDPVGEIKLFTPFANYLAQELSADGIDEVKIVIASDVRQMVKMLKHHEVDLFIDSSITASIINQLSGSQFMLRRWKKGRGKYRSVIFVTEDSGIKRLDDLKDKVIAFEEPFSTSGYVLPALVILQSGNELYKLQSLRSEPEADKVSYVMAYDNETQMVWLERGRVAAAAMAESDFLEYSNNVLVPLKSLYTTPYVPYHVVVRRPGLEERLVQRIKDVLLVAHEGKQGVEVMMSFEKTTKFDEIPDDLLSEIKKLEQYLGDVTVN
ncbi:MAG: phosphate/phosphite/phosphonate ABC transporter substrate-binding protein [Halopseudomonas aestusnigri]